jgi:outer membrane immunogenic protein
MFAPNWSLKGEYQYISLGSINQVASAIAPEVGEVEGATAVRHVKENFNTVRIGVNYHFGGPALGGY